MLSSAEAVISFGPMRKYMTVVHIKLQLVSTRSHLLSIMTFPE